MSASLDEQAKRSLTSARHALARLRKATDEARAEQTRFVRDALVAGWSWERMARELDVSSTAVRRHWQRNRHQASRLGGS